MSDTNFQPIFDYIDTRMQEQTEEFFAEMATKKDIEKVLTAIGDIAKSTKDNSDKILVQEHKSERLEHWVMEAAEKVEVPYKP